MNIVQRVICIVAIRFDIYIVEIIDPITIFKAMYGTIIVITNVGFI